MIKWSLFESHPFVREAIGKEVDQSLHVCRSEGIELREHQEWDALDIHSFIVQVGVREIATAGVELDDLSQSSRVSHMEVRTAVLDISQIRCLEGAVGYPTGKHRDVRDEPGNIWRQAPRWRITAEVLAESCQFHQRHWERLPGQGIGEWRVGDSALVFRAAG